VLYVDVLLNTPSNKQMSFIFRRLFSSTSPVTMDAAKTKAQQLIDENAVSTYTLYPHIHLNTIAPQRPGFAHLEVLQNFVLTTFPSL
jgi:hypothetical protein